MTTKYGLSDGHATHESGLFATGDSNGQTSMLS